MKAVWYKVVVVFIRDTNELMWKSVVNEYNIPNKHRLKTLFVTRAIYVITDGATISKVFKKVKSVFYIIVNYHLLKSLQRSFFS